MSTYILQKDITTPMWDIKAGSEFQQGASGGAYACGNFSLPPAYVEQKPDWFKRRSAQVHINIDPEWKVFTIVSADGTHKKINLDAEYTEEDMRKCFYAAVERHLRIGFAFNDFEDYLKTIK